MIGHVTPKISDCKACLLYRLDDTGQEQSSLDFRVQPGTIWDRLGKGKVPWYFSICLFLSLHVLVGQRASGVGLMPWKSPGRQPFPQGGRCGIGSVWVSMHWSLSRTFTWDTAYSQSRRHHTPILLMHTHPCLTCRHEEDASAQDDVVACLVKLACCDAEATHKEQDHTQDREDT